MWASSLPGFGFRQASGLYWDGQTMHVVRLASSWLGPRELERSHSPARQEPAASFSGALEQAFPRARRPRVVLGVPAEKCYFATRPVSVAAGASAKTLLRESLRSSTPVDRMAADMVVW